MPGRDGVFISSLDAPCSRLVTSQFDVSCQDDTALTEGVQQREIIETSYGLYRCEAIFANWGTRNGRVDFLDLDREKLEFDKAIKVKYADEALFDGRNIINSSANSRRI